MVYCLNLFRHLDSQAGNHLQESIKIVSKLKYEYQLHVTSICI